MKSTALFLRKREIMKRHLLTVLILLCLCLTACDTSVNNDSSSHSESKVSNSGPITYAMEDESSAIRNAPAYDVADAKKYIDSMPDVRELIDNIEPSPIGVTAFGEKKPSDEALDNLFQEIQVLSEGDHEVSLMMVDLRSKAGVAYNYLQPMCTQSTIKAIYVGSVLDDNPDALKENGAYMREAIEFSENEPYHNLREIYGTAPLVKWCSEVGVDEGFTERLYPCSYTVKDMFKMWTKLYCFLNSDDIPGNFGAYYADSSCSATKKQLGGRFPVQTKAGWEGGLDEGLNYDPDAIIPDDYIDKDPTNDECAINDTGIVYSDHGPYIFVIYTDHPFSVFRDYATENPLYELTERLYEVQCSLNNEH